MRLLSGEDRAALDFEIRRLSFSQPVGYHE
jgi:hypothetical protein